MIKSDNFNFYKESLDYILKVQMADGSISWEKDKKLDPLGSYRGGNGAGHWWKRS